MRRANLAPRPGRFAGYAARFMKLFDVLFGRPLASDEAHSAQISPAVGIPIFGLDGLTGAAYGPEAAMTLLI